ncbi:MAG: hypothetical protein NC040_07330 [Muribaculaceae bacterium]|nr:hypothetical protein [Alistipes senegalensis]MCM1473854.1 hypothetical protein [Muribaculaceae bacterium]
MHYSKYSLRLVMNTIAFKPYRYTTIAVSLSGLNLTFFYLFRKFPVLRRSVHSLYKIIVSAT